MKAHVGDWLVVERTTAAGRKRRGQIIEIRHQDGSPPYLVRWLESGHETLVFPGQNAHVRPELTDGDLRS